MTGKVPMIDLTRIKVLPLAQRRSLSRVDEVLKDPEAPPAPCPETILNAIRECSSRIMEARRRQANVILMYGAHLLRNGAAQIIERLMAQGWLTHLATNGAGSIHDWEFAYAGRSTESVKENVATGTFGAWDETGKNIMIALLAGGIKQEGYGRALGRFIMEDGAVLPTIESTLQMVRELPLDPMVPAAADLMQAMRSHWLEPGKYTVKHPWKHASILGQAFRHQVPLTVHPGIGYDIITVHPMFNGAAVGRAAALDFRSFASAVEGLDHGVVISIGSAIMAPQVFEKSLSCVNNLRRQGARDIVRDHAFYVVDIQEGGHWDWSKGEPPKTNPAYYLRFCKSFSRMGGVMQYLDCDNVTFIHHLYHQLSR